MKTLAEVIVEHTFGDESLSCWCGEWRPEVGRDDDVQQHAEHVAAAWRTERTVTTAAELDALPYGAIIRVAEEFEGNSMAWEKQQRIDVCTDEVSTCWVYFNEERDYASSEIETPVEVLYLPGEEA